MALEPVSAMWIASAAGTADADTSRFERVVPEA
jgi:hypothetical protein